MAWFATNYMIVFLASQAHFLIVKINSSAPLESIYPGENYQNEGMNGVFFKLDIPWIGVPNYCHSVDDCHYCIIAGNLQ